MGLVSEICDALPRLDVWQLQAVSELVSEFLYETEEREQELEPEPAAGDEGESKAGGSRWTEVKCIKGHYYRYERWREGGKLRSKYLGKASETID